MAPEQATTRGWLIWALAACFYAYGFLLRVAPSVMVDELMRDLAVGGAMLGTLSAAYFYAYASVQIPGGVMLDRFGPRMMIACACTLAAIGAGLFAIADSVAMALAARACIGFGVAFGYIGCLTLASAWFPPRRYGLVAGLTLTAGLAGAILGQAPLALLVETAGWRQTMLITAVAGLVIAVLVALLIRNRPADQPAPVHAKGSLADGVGTILADRQVWLMLVYNGMIAAPTLTFAGLWGVPYLVQVHDLSRAGAGGITSLMLVAWGISGPFMGWLSDRIGARTPPQRAGAALQLICCIILLYAHNLPLIGVAALCITMGIAGGAMIVTFAHGRDRHGGSNAGTVAGVLNTSVLGIGAVAQTVVGRMLDIRWAGDALNGARIYDADAFSFAFLTFVIASTLALLASLLLREVRHTPVPAPA
ncbi:MAG: MFS transporter [Geminicoccaceae bacterium]